MKEKLKRDKNSLEDHLTYIDSLKGEISLISNHKTELQHQVSQLLQEKDSLSDSLDYSVGKIFSLEKKQRDQENLLRSSERELLELKTSNQLMLEKMETWSFSRASSQSCNTSIMSELELCTSDSDLISYRSKSFDTIHEEDEEMEEYDENTLEAELESSKLKGEVVRVCEKLQNMCHEIKGTHSDQIDHGGTGIQMPQLESVVEELETLIHENVTSSANSISVSCQTSLRLDQLEKQLLREDLERKNSEVQRLVIKSTEAEAEIIRKEIIIEGISEKLAVLKSRLLQVENYRRTAEETLDSFKAEYQQKIEEMQNNQERLENNSQEQNENSPPASSSSHKGNLLKKLEEFEEELKEIIANKNKPRNNATKGMNVNNIIKAGTNNNLKKPLTRR